MTFLAKSDVSTPIAFLKSVVFAWSDKSNSTSTLSPEDFGFGKYSLIYNLSFYQTNC